MIHPSNHPFENHPSSASCRTRRAGSAVASVLITFVFSIVSAPAQSASNFDTTPLTPKVPTPKIEKAAATPKTPAGPVNTTASRFVSDEDLDGYVQSLTGVFSIQKRTADPFGQMQDPDAKPIIKQVIAKGPRRITQIQATPFSEIVRLIKVTTIMPMEKRFLIGTRSIKQGQCLPINFRSKIINAQVVSVSSQQIMFRNIDNGETASLELKILPVGMTPGTKGITAPGMTPDSPNAPLELEGGPLPTENSQNQ